jgi:hypothetical protein
MIVLNLNKKEQELLVSAVNAYRDIPDFRDPSTSKEMELLRAKVLVSVSEVTE